MNKYLTIDAIRRQNSRTLADSNGSRAEFARRIDRPATQVSRFMGNRPTVKIGDELARTIEQAHNIERGWLDNVHEQQPVRDPDQVPLVDWDMIKPDTPAASNTLVTCPVAHGPGTFATQIVGTAMQRPQGICYPERSTVFVDPTASIKNGDAIIAYLHDRDAITFRAFYLDGSDEYLSPLNPMLPATYGREFTPIGLVIGCWTDRLAQ